jgi:ketosteroid isomerase-like protein
MKKTLVILAFIFTWIAARGQGSTPVVDPNAEQAITHLREGLVESFNHDDIDKLLTYLDPNAVVTWQNGEVCEGAAAVKAYYQRMMKGDHPVVKKVSADPKVIGRHFQGDWAVSWGDLNDRFILADGSELPLNSHFTATIARRGDRWLVVAFHASVNAFENPVMYMAIKKASMVSGVVALLVGLLVGVLGTLLLRRRKKNAV